MLGVVRQLLDRGPGQLSPGFAQPDEGLLLDLWWGAHGACSTGSSVSPGLSGVHFSFQAYNFTFVSPLFSMTVTISEGRAVEVCLLC